MQRKKIIRFIGLVGLIGLIGLTGCTAGKAVESASGKNLNLDGYLMVGDVESSSSETGTPQGRLIIGRVTYKSRKVGIPADQKVPTTGYFKSTETEVCSGRKRRLWNMILRRARKPKRRERGNSLRRNAKRQSPESTATER